MSRPPEAQARQQIDAQLVAAGWTIHVDKKSGTLRFADLVALEQHPSSNPLPTPSKSALIADSHRNKVARASCPVYQLFGSQLDSLLNELNQTLAA